MHEQQKLLATQTTWGDQHLKPKRRHGDHHDDDEALGAQLARDQQPRPHKSAGVSGGGDRAPRGRGRAAGEAAAAHSIARAPGGASEGV